LGLPDVKPDKLEAAYCFEKAQALRVTSAKKSDGAGVAR
jgi:hypothetical protein